MASYNRANCVSAAINSVLNQTFKEWELLVLDDASTDNTEEIVLKYAEQDERIKYFKHGSNLGVSENRNFGLQKACGKYIAVLDSDDIWIDTKKLEKQYNLLENNPGIGLVGTFMIKLLENGKDEKISYETTDQQIRDKMLLRNQFTHSSVLYRKDLAEGDYNANLKLAEDYELWLRMGLKTKFANIPDYAVLYNVSANSETGKNKFKIARTVDKIINCYKKDYPNYQLASVKSALRMIRSLLF